MTRGGGVSKLNELKRRWNTACVSTIQLSANFQLNFLLSNNVYINDLYISCDSYVKDLDLDCTEPGQPHIRKQVKDNIKTDTSVDF